jgi:hypothetical protein
MLFSRRALGRPRLAPLRGAFAGKLPVRPASRGNTSYARIGESINMIREQSQ